jgi:hypothetical protein
MIDVTVPVSERSVPRGGFPSYHRDVRVLQPGVASSRADYQRMVAGHDYLTPFRALARAAWWQSIADAQARKAT